MLRPRGGKGSPGKKWPSWLGGQAASDARAEKEFVDTEVVMDRLDEHTAGGIRAVLDRIDALEQKLAARPAN